MNKKDYIYLGTIFVLVCALGVLSYKYNDQSTKQMNKCYQMFEQFSDAIKQGSQMMIHEQSGYGYSVTVELNKIENKRRKLL